MPTTPPLTAHKAAVRRPIPGYRIAISVSEACEELWSVQDAVQGQSWLQMLHSALLRERVDAYDPSDAFLAIQAAALNFPATWEHALWAAAALVRVCVGPAWRWQRLDNHAYGSTSTTLSDSTGESSPRPQHNSPRSFSPLSVDAAQLQLQQTYPYIPEVLPGALLRFAAQSPRVSRSVAEAQRELVLALCCLDDGGSFNERSLMQWNIPGAHEPVGAMMRFWLESATATYIPEQDASEEKQEISPAQPVTQEYPIVFKTNESVASLTRRLSGRTMDWWYTLNVARACSDLVSVGWRPCQYHEIITLHLLDIVEQGVFLRHMSPIAIDQESREKRLAATSSAAEALSAFASLGSNGLLPHSCLPDIVALLLRLQITAGMSSKHLNLLYPLGTPQSLDQQNEWEQERETFYSQRASCFTDTADFLWILLAQESSAVTVMATLLDGIDEDEQRGAVIVRIVSGALWGKPPNVPGIATLRIYWKEFLEALTRLGIRGVRKLTGKDEESDGLTRRSMTLTLEVVVAFGRLVETEFVGGRGALAADEWDSFLAVLRDVVTPCLQLKADTVAEVYFPKEDDSLRAARHISKRLTIESEAVLVKLGKHLEQCSRSPCHRNHLIADDVRREALYTLLLRDAAPFLAKGQGPYLATMVLRSRAAIGFSYDRRETWVDTARAIVKDAFAVYEGPSFADYGGYVHSPVVRLEALLLLSNDGSDILAAADIQTIDTVVTSEASGGTSVLSSPLTSLKCLEDDYREFVQESIFPCLSLVFQRAVSGSGHGSVLQFSDPLRSQAVTVGTDLWNFLADNSKFETHDHRVATFKLCKYSVDLIGRLFCNPYETTECRSRFVGILRDISKMEVIPIPDDAITSDDASRATRVVERERFANTVTNRSLLALEAIGQLETCLCAPFFSVPFAHESLPSIIAALCEVLRYSSRTINSEIAGQSMQQKYSFRLLLHAALLPLSRLRRTRDGGIMVVERDEVMDHFSDGIVQLFDERHCEVIDDEGPFIAPFAYVDVKRRARDVSSSTFVTFEPIVVVLLEILHMSLCGPETVTGEGVHPNGRALELDNRFRASCYDAFLNYALSAAPIDYKHIFEVLVSVTRSEGAYCNTENFARLRSSMALFQRVSLDPSTIISIPSEMRLLVDQVLMLCRSKETEEVLRGCQLLIGVFPTMAPSQSEMHAITLLQLHQEILATLISSIRDVLGHKSLRSLSKGKDAEQTRIVDRGSSLLLLLYETSLYYLESFDSLESAEAKALVRLCFDVAGTHRLSRASRTLAVRCAVTVVEQLKDEDLQVIIEDYAHFSGDDLSFDGVSVASQLEVPESDIVLSAISKRILKLGSEYPMTKTDLQDHYDLAKEVDNIKSFNLAKDCAAAWLCGDHLLTCKVGGSKTRTCGWVEVTVRGATFRRRELIRLSDEISLDDPEFPSSLWTTVSPKHHETVETKSSSILKAPETLGDDSVMKKAMELLQRADEVLENYPVIAEGNDVDSFEHANRGSSTRSEGPTPPSSPRPISDDSHHSTRSWTIQEGLPNPTIPTQIETSDPESVRAWLLETLKGPAQVNDVVDRLSELNLEAIIDGGNNAADGLLRYRKIDLHPVRRLELDERATRAINLLDRTVALDTHKIALMFAGPPNARNKDDEDEVDLLLKAPAASPEFFKFANGLGDLVSTRHLKYFSAGLDTSGSDTDGKYALVWIEHNATLKAPTFLTIYHAVPFMPQNFNNRKRHVGNDSVHIVFCDHGSFLYEQLWAGGPSEEMENVLVSGQFGFVTIFVVPTGDGAFRVKLQLRPALPETTRTQLQHLAGEDILPAAEAPKFVRRLANIADIACSSVMHDLLGPPTSWEIRLRQLRLMRRHAVS